MSRFRPVWTAGAYELTYLLPQEWMNAAERAYPVVLDPIVEADLRAKNIQDQTVAPGKNFNYLWGMVEAGSMFGWHAGVGTGARGESSASAVPQTDTHVYAVAGDPREEKSRYQNFHITGSKGDVYTVAGWAKGDSVPLKDGARKFGITARFTYTDGTTDDQMVSFNPDAEQWQYGFYFTNYFSH